VTWPPSPTDQQQKVQSKGSIQKHQPQEDVSTPPLTHSPLYQQVANLLATRVDEGYWRAGDMLPSEFDLADELRVSQGTVRKAIGTLEQRGIVERRQGRGTFVTTSTEERSFFHFFRLAKADGNRITPEPCSERIKRRRASKREIDVLASNDQEVFEILRVRKADGVVACRECMIVPCSLAPGLDTFPAELPNSLYPFYQQQFGTMVLRTDESIAAVAASKTVARSLQITPDTPVLEVTRTAFDIKNRAVELRISHFRSDNFRYQVSLQ